MSRALTTAFLSCVAALALGADGGAADKPELGAFLPAQAAADVLKSMAGSDGAFLIAEQLKSTYSKDNLASLLEFSTDTIVVLNLTGSQIKQAFERSLSQYPQENTSFLQISGFEVTFNQKVKPGSRVVKITADGAPLDEKHTYTVAMPLLLGNGIGGYFKIWQISQLARSIDNKTMESVLSGKPYVATSPRWLAQ